MLAYYMDHQFRASVTCGLRQRSIDVLTTLDDGTEQLADEPLLARATELGRVIVTHDKGFLALASKWSAAGQDFTGIAFSVQRTFHVGKAIEYLHLMATIMTPEEMLNRVEYIPSH